MAGPAIARIMYGSPQYWLPRLVFQRGLGLIYFIAFLIVLNQWKPLLGEHGLLPASLYLKQIRFAQAPSLFFWNSSDAAVTAAGWVGLALSLVTMAGLSERWSAGVSAAVWFALWAIYLSFVHAGQTFYGFGWESMLCEAGFFAIFLGSARTAPLPIPIWALRWMAFRVMFGAGLIKLRGDSCWRDLTCLDTHYETQPIPNPLSWYFHWQPRWMHHGGVLVNHLVELLVPFAFFAPQPWATIGALITVAFQATLMLSGNLSFLNLLTIVIVIPALDGRLLARLLPLRIPAMAAPGVGLQYGAVVLGVAVVLLSIPVTLNMISPGQLMNYSYNPLELVNTYGAFGSISRARYEVVVEGTDAAEPGPEAQWREYEFRGKPGDPMRRPPQIAPYHLRLDWLMWFAAMSRYTDQPWFISFMAKLLQNDQPVLGLLRKNPFPDRPPHFVRARMYGYEFTTPEERRKTGAWWKRDLLGDWFPEVSLDTPAFQRILREQGWQ